MKKTLTIFSLFIGLVINAQILNYDEFGILLSQENKQGTARTMAMKGAFGALGGDLSAISINPASGAVFMESAATFTLGFNQKDLMSDFYGNQVQNSNSNLNVAQIGGLLVFNNNTQEDGLNKIAIALNYGILNNFNNSWVASSTSFPASYFDYPNVEFQQYKNITSGKQAELNFSIAAQFNDVLYIGASLNAYNINYIEDSTREEIAYDNEGNYIDSFESFWQEVQGDGLSLGLGAIFKITQGLRLGLSYISPVWYEIHEENNMFEEYTDDAYGYYDVFYSNDPPAYGNNINKIQAYDYALRTPSKLTGSIAYVFGKQGLISADVTRKNYKGINLNPNIIQTNEYIDTILKASYKLNFGTEWRIDKISIRGGYSYEQNPYTDAIDSDNLTGIAFGLGYDFGKFTIDIAYDYSEQTDYYNFYPDINFINGSELTKNYDKVIATVAFKL